MKQIIFYISLMICFQTYGQEDKFPYMSDLVGKNNIENVILLEYMVNSSDELHLKQNNRYHFDSKGRIILWNASYTSLINLTSFNTHTSLLIDSLVYDSKDNLIESYRFRPNRNTLESKYLMVYNSENDLIEKKMFDSDGSIFSTFTLIKNTKNFKEYLKTFSDGDSRTNEFLYDDDKDKIELIVKNKDSILLHETYEYDKMKRLTKLSHYNSKGNIIATTSYSYDEAGNILFESKINATNEEIEYKYEYTYDKYNNYLTEKDSFSDGVVNSFRFEYLYDDRGNWIKQIAYDKEKKSGIYERQIEYR